MTDEDALLAAVVAAPDDDLPRLVYADWLDDHGDPDRAEFIRLQIGAARLTGMQRHGPRGREGQRRTARLLDAHRAEWSRPIGHVTGVKVLFARGFVETVHATSSPVFYLRAELFRRQPVRDLLMGPDWYGIPPEERHFGGPPGLQADGVRALTVWPELARLRSLALPIQGIDDPGAEALAGCPYLAGLTHLGLAGNQVTDDGVRALARSPHLGRPERLDLSYNWLGPSGLRAVAASPHLARLRLLNLTGTRAAGNSEALAVLARRLGDGLVLR